VHVESAGAKGGRVHGATFDSVVPFLPVPERDGVELRRMPVRVPGGDDAQQRFG